MNQKTLITLAVFAAVGAVAYVAYKKHERATSLTPVVVQVPTAGNVPANGSGNNAAAIIGAGTDALSRITDIFRA